MNKTQDKKRKSETSKSEPKSKKTKNSDKNVVPVISTVPLPPLMENGSSRELPQQDLPLLDAVSFLFREYGSIWNINSVPTVPVKISRKDAPSGGAGLILNGPVNTNTTDSSSGKLNPMEIDTSEIQQVDESGDKEKKDAKDDKDDQDEQSIDYGEYLKGKYFISTWLIPAVFFYVIAHSIEKGIFASDSVFIEGIGGLVSTCVCNLISNYSENVLSYIGQNRAEYFFQHTEEFFFVPCLVLPYILLYNLFVANQYCTEIIPSQRVWVVDDGFRYLARTDEKEIESGYVYKNDYIFVWTFVILSIMAIYFRHKKYMYFWQVSLMSMYLLLAARITNSRILPTDPTKKYPSCSDLPNDTALIRSPEYWWPTRVLMWFLKLYTRVEDQTLYMALLGLENNGRHRFDLWFFGSY